MPIREHLILGLAWLSLVSCSIITTVHAQPGVFDVAQLMQLLAKIENREASFTEKKQLALLTDPLISKGTLRYRRPNYLERNTATPKPERFVYENDTILIEANGRQRRIQASAQPALGALVESLRATLAGDEASLRRHYKMQLTGTGVNWSLEMAPIDANLAQRIRQIRISGSQEQLRLVEVFEISGDQTQMTIDTARP